MGIIKKIKSINWESEEVGEKLRIIIFVVLALTMILRMAAHHKATKPMHIQMTPETIQILRKINEQEQRLEDEKKLLIMLEDFLFEIEQAKAGK